MTYKCITDIMMMIIVHYRHGIHINSSRIFQSFQWVRLVASLSYKVNKCMKSASSQNNIRNIQKISQSLVSFQRVDHKYGWLQLIFHGMQMVLEFFDKSAQYFEPIFKRSCEV